MRQALAPKPASSEPLRPDSSTAAFRSNIAAATRFCSSRWAGFQVRVRQTSRGIARRGSFFATVTLPIFFEHTVPVRVVQLRGSVSSFYEACRASYLRWAEAFMFRPTSGESSRVVVRLRFSRWFRA
jgi:hypothetical protein